MLEITREGEEMLGVRVFLWRGLPMTVTSRKVCSLVGFKIKLSPIEARVLLENGGISIKRVVGAEIPVSEVHSGLYRICEGI